MTTIGNELPEPDPEVIGKGKIACVVKGNPQAIERWVQMVAQKTGARVDWYFNENKQAQVMHLGDYLSLWNVLKVIETTQNEFMGEVIAVRTVVR